MSATTSAPAPPKPVYRLEDANGFGPYHGDQPCARFLKPHDGPVDLIRLMGYPKEILAALSGANFVFGWSSKRLFNRFFQRNGQKACAELGFNMQIYRPSLKLVFPDGQVMFARDGLHLSETPLLAELLKGLSSRRWRRTSFRTFAETTQS